MLQSYTQSITNAIEQLDSLISSQNEKITQAEETRARTLFLCQSDRFNLREQMTFIAQLRATLAEMEDYKKSLKRELASAPKAKRVAIK